MRKTPALISLTLAAVLCARAEAAPMLEPLGAVGAAPAAPWHVVGLPGQTKPFTAFSLVATDDGKTALKVQADSSYGNLVHPLQLAAGAAKQLAWQWRAEQLNDVADLHVRAGDDTTLKVCVLFDQPLDKVPFLDRQLLAVARSRSSDPVPTATVCYVWDDRLSIGTVLNSPFTGRLRYVVLQSGAGRVGQWVSERRDIAADFARAFGGESADVPPIEGVAIGADADNTHGHSVGFVRDIELMP